MHIAEILHDLIEHSPAYSSQANREAAHQAVDDTYPDHEDTGTDQEPAEQERGDRIAELEAELAALKAIEAADAEPAPAGS